VRSWTCFSSRSDLCLFSQQLVAFQRVLAEDLDYAPHFRDLVAAGNINWTVVSATGNSEHAAAETHEAADEIAADIEPDNQDRADQAQGRKGEQDARAQLLNGECVAGRRPDVSLGLQNQAIYLCSEADGQSSIFGNQFLGLADQIEFLSSDGEYRIRSDRQRANAPDLIDEQGAQFGVELFGVRVKII
jgi:hypothetical protein